MQAERCLPPQNIEAEMSILGAILIENESIERALEVMTPEDLYRESHRKIMRAMIELNERGEPCDLITMTTILKCKGELEEVGGGAYLATLVDFVPMAANIAYYCRIVHEAAVRRVALHHLLEVKEKITEGGDPVTEIIEKAAGQLLKLGETGRLKKGPVPIKELLSPSIKNLEARCSGEGATTGILSGLGALDSRVNGFRPGELIVIAARPSMGKTALALNIARYAAMTALYPTPVALFSLEMSGESLVDRFLSSCGMVDASRIRSGRVASDDWANLTRAAGTIHQAPIWIDDTSELTPGELRSKARRLKAKHDIGLIVIDYLQLMRGSSKTESRQQEISEISRSLKGLAKELGVPVIALSQLNRSLENRNDKRPMMSDLRESGAIEQDADLILFIYREAVYCEACKRDDGSCDKGHEDAAEIIIGKQRSGGIGTVQVQYDGRYTLFRDRGEQ